MLVLIFVLIFVLVFVLAFGDKETVEGDEWYEFCFREASLLGALRDTEAILCVFT